MRTGGGMRPRPPRHHTKGGGQKRVEPLPAVVSSVSPKAEHGVVELPASLTVKELAELLEVTPSQVIKELLSNGVITSINQVIDYDTAAIVAQGLGFETREAVVVQAEEEIVSRGLAPVTRGELEERALLQPRPAVVTIMGHVDHGKTSLLDAIRETEVTAREVGGITQHIGAYQVEVHGKKITFLDTPGHEAFTAMRARGAQVTDLAVLVVAADDGVMPQTLEAIDHARAAKVPIIVALNKIDKPEANPQRVKQQLADAGLLIEEWGGDAVCVPVSAKKKMGIEHLLEMVLLVAEMAELKANPDRAARGVVIEARLDRTRGAVATVLIQDGTLKIGDNVLIGSIYGKVRAMFNDKGKRVKKAESATPVEILGLTGIPQAGDTLEVVHDEKTARAIAAERAQQKEAVTTTPAHLVSLDDLFAQIQSGRIKELNIILKTDVQGSIEPIKTSLEGLSTDKVKVNIIHQGAGSITESDVLLAQASKAIIIGFNTRPEPGAKRAAEATGVDIRFYDIIYNVIDDVGKALAGLLEPTYTQVIEGHAEVRQLFRIGKGQIVGGCMVTDGQVSRTAQCRVLRDGSVVCEGRIGGLRRFKDDVKEVQSGFECGISIEGFNDLQVGDIIESFRRERTN